MSNKQLLKHMETKVSIEIAALAEDRDQLWAVETHGDQGLH